jgi:hypothetical protein
LLEALQANIQGSRHAGKFIARFVSALLKTGTSGLVKIANSFDSEAGSVYKEIQGFLKMKTKFRLTSLFCGKQSITKALRPPPNTRKVLTLAENADAQIFAQNLN